MRSHLILKKIGKNLRQARRNANLTQEKLAEKIPMDRAYYGKLERGEVNVSILMLDRISEEIDCPIFMLLK